MVFADEDKTYWFDGAKYIPGQTGLYERKYSSGTICECYWDGKNWHMPQVLRISRNTVSNFQNRPFRGLRFKVE